MGMGLSDRAEFDALVLRLEEIEERDRLILAGMKALLEGKRPMRLLKQIAEIAVAQEEADGEAA